MGVGLCVDFSQGLWDGSSDLSVAQSIPRIRFYGVTDGMSALNSSIDELEKS